MFLFHGGFGPRFSAMRSGQISKRPKDANSPQPGGCNSSRHYPAPIACFFLE